MEDKITEATHTSSGNLTFLIMCALSINTEVPLSVASEKKIQGISPARRYTKKDDVPAPVSNRTFNIIENKNVYSSI